MYGSLKIFSKRSALLWYPEFVPQIVGEPGAPAFPMVKATSKNEYFDNLIIIYLSKILPSVVHWPHATDGAAAVVAATVQVACVAIVKV